MKATPSNPKWSIIPPQINSVSISDDGSRCAFGSSYERGSGDFFTFLYDGEGNLIWKKPIISDQKTYQGVFWVSVSGDGKYVASGGETVNTKLDPSNTTPGFLQAYEATTGAQLLNITLNARINQVSLSKDGMYLATCYGKTVEIFQLNEAGTSYTSIKAYQSETYNINSCVISRDGTTVVASGITYPDGTDAQAIPPNKASETVTTGKVFSYTIAAGVVTDLGSCDLTTGCMRVAVVDTGQYWAASLHDGSCMLFNRVKPNEKEWQYTPAKSNIMLAYAVDITLTDNNEIYIACGANLWGPGDGGFLYLVKSTRMVYTEDPDNLGYPAAKYEGTAQWSSEIQYGVNPGVSMDKNATYVTATDGKPDGQTINESAGSFYLFNASNGNMVWQKQTYMMNWPMMLSRDGNSVIGGSDDGSFYFWQAPYTVEH